MNDMEYNLYIENYLKNDKTKSAIMLTAPWGMGKSYYIQNCLIPHLEQMNDKECVVVSLYGLNDIKEISKAIIACYKMFPPLRKEENTLVPSKHRRQ